MKKKEWLILGIITIIAGVALGCTHLLTRDSIADQEVRALNAARFSVMPEAQDFAEETLAEGATLDSLHRAVKGDEVLGYVGQATVSGFGGPIVVVLGVDGTGTVTGMSAGGSAFAETAGLGTKVKEPEFTNQFIGLTSAPELKGNVDAISGVTVSSSAVTNGAKQIYQYISAIMTGGDVPVAETAIPITAADVRTVTATGFAGEIEVKVGVNPDGSIEAIEVGGANFSETPGIGAAAQEPAFVNQFAGRSGVLSFSDDGLDAIAGATITSDAVLKAVNEAMGNAEAGDAVVVPEATAEAEAQAKENPTVASDANTVTETVKGFAGEIEVTVGIDASGAITSMAVGGSKFNETEDFGAQAQEEKFTSQFIGKSGELSYGKNGLEAISGATVTSDAVLKAVNTALSASAQPTAASDVKIVTETVKGFAGEIEVTVGIDANGAITSMAVGGSKFNETEDFGAQAQDEKFTSQFIGKSGELSYGKDGLEAISGATVTSDAVLKAVNTALSASAQPTAASDVKIMTETVKGFAGEIEVTVGIDANGAITSMTVGGSKFNETEDFGAQAQEEKFTSQFIGKSGELSYGKDGLEAISGATVTSDAVLKAVNAALSASAQPTAASDAKTVTETVKGFAGEIEVTVGIDANGAITSMTVGGSKFNETEDFGAQAQEEKFTSQFIGKSGELSYGKDGLEAISGATVTSDAVLKAVNAALVSK